MERSEIRDGKFFHQKSHLNFYLTNKDAVSRAIFLRLASSPGFRLAFHAGYQSMNALMCPRRTHPTVLAGFQDAVFLGAMLELGGAEIDFQIARGSSGAGDFAFGLVVQIVERVRADGHRMPPLTWRQSTNASDDR
jgi:hypothetical protein